MKVFEVTTEHCEDDSKEIITTREYVTSGDDSLLAVAQYYTEHCHDYEKDLIAVREVLIVVRHIDQ